MGDAILVLDEPTIFGNKKIRTGTISGAASYATSGDTVVGGWNQVLGMKVDRIIIAAGDVNYFANLSGDLLLAYYAGAAAAEFDQVTNADNLTASVVPFIAIGRV